MFLDEFAAGRDPDDPSWSEELPEVSATYFGDVGLDNALESFFFEIEMMASSAASAFVLVIGNAEWGVHVRSRLDDPEWVSWLTSEDEAR